MRANRRQDACAPEMRELISSFNEQFARLHHRSAGLIKKLSPNGLYARPQCRTTPTSSLSCGEYVLRSAAAVEQTFGGISVNLWDDPFEWTLPETLASADKVIEYLNEVEATRNRGLALFKDDEELLKEIVAPSGNTLLVSLLLDTLVTAAHYLGAAEATFVLLRDQA